MAIGRVTGQVGIRPIRLAMLLQSEPDALRRAVEMATSAWGGVYTMLWEPRRARLALADGLGVDALYALDETARSAALAATTGYLWHGRGEWAPYAEPKEHMSARLLGPEWLLDRLPKGTEPYLARWSDEDPLADLFSVWLGRYPSGEFGQHLAAAVERHGKSVELVPKEPVVLPSGVSPIELTAKEIEYSGLHNFHGFVVVDPNNPKHLRLCWNARALGGDIFPWPLVDAHRLGDAARAWLADRVNSGVLSSWRRGDGTPLPPHCSVMLFGRGGAVPADLLALLESVGLEPHPEWYFAAPGWSGAHPFATSFDRHFSTEIDRQDWSFAVGLPEFVPALRRDSVVGSMVVAAQVEIYQEHGLGSTRWVSLPNVRGLAPLLQAGSLPTTVRRPVLGGRAFSVEVSAEEARVEIVAAMDVVTKLFEESGWECSQSDPGHFAMRLSDILGGPGTTVMNQPAAREVLLSTGRSPTGKKVGELLAEAKKHSGAWPNRMWGDQSTDAYAKGVVDLLLYRKLLQPYFTVRCPECAIPMTVRPEDLTSNASCTMCSAEFPLGYALAQSRLGQGWRYRLPQDLAPDRLAEAVTLLAAVSAVGASGVFDGRSLHQFGVELKTPRRAGQPREHECELDLFMVIHDGGNPDVIIGEVKHRGYLEQTDLDNLIRVRDWFLGRGFNCYPLFATMRDELRSEEQAMLRLACESAPRVLGGQVLPLFPIVLLRTDLSSAPLEEDHPRSWRTTAGAYSNLSSQAAVRNLGLQHLDWVPSWNSSRWACQWSD